MVRYTLLCDVDGVVADLIGGFSTYLWYSHGIVLNPRDVDNHKIAKCTKLVKVNQYLAECQMSWSSTLEPIEAVFSTFMGIDDVYRKFVKPVDGAKEALSAISEYADIVFVTANMSDVPESYVSKYRWLKQHFTDIPIITTPSDLKHMVTGDWAVDDRYDICDRWSKHGVATMMFGRPWSGAPDGFVSYDWSMITERILHDCRKAEELQEKIKGGFYYGEF